MAQPYVGEIRMFAGNFAPAGWMFCEGQLLPISENETLFQLIGTTYGGDGESTFALPDLRGRLPVHQGNGFILAETGGAEEITLTVNQISAHSHPMLATVGNATAKAPTRSGLRRRPRRCLYDVIFGARDESAEHFANGRQPAAHELSAVSVRGFHHLAVRHLPVPDLERGSSVERRDPGNQTKEREMADPFVAEIRIFPFNFAPRGWAWCDGQLLAVIAEHSTVLAARDDLRRRR